LSVIPAARAILAAGALAVSLAWVAATPAADLRGVTDSAGRRAELPARVEPHLRGGRARELGR
jgi:hypothetical protein